MIFTLRNEVAKVMFLHVSVILSGGGGGIPACNAGDIPTCLAPGGVLFQHALQLGGLLWGVCSWGGLLLEGLLPDPPSGKQTATVPDGMHPTGMHSCYISY